MSSDARQREVWYTYGDPKHAEHELPEHARLRVYLPHRPNAFVEIAYADGGVDLRGSDALMIQMNASNAAQIHLADRYELRDDAHKRDLAEQIYDRLAERGADYNAMCELASELRDDPGNWRQAHPWVRQVYDVLARRFTRAKAKT